jgi:hypothetical protein
LRQPIYERHAADPPKSRKYGVCWGYHRPR